MAKIYKDGKWVEEADAYAVGTGNTGNTGNNYQEQINGLMEQINNRKPFQFDLGSNALYNQHKQQYTLAGQKAMQDTMGQASGLTGGYGSSYAQSVGNQAYNDYLTKLNAVVPEIYAQERSAYDAAGDDMYKRLSMLQGLQGADEDRAYREWQMAQAEQSAAGDRERQQWQQQQTERGNALSYVQYLLGLGVMPGADQLAAAGMTSAEAQAIIDRYNSQYAGTGAGSRGGGSSDSGGYPSVTPSGAGTNSGDPLLKTVKGALGAVSDYINSAAGTAYDTFVQKTAPQPLSSQGIRDWADSWASSGNLDVVPAQLRRIIDGAYATDKERQAVYEQIRAAAQQILNRRRQSADPNYNNMYQRNRWDRPQ